MGPNTSKGGTQSGPKGPKGPKREDPIVLAGYLAGVTFKRGQKGSKGVPKRVKKGQKGSKRVQKGQKRVPLTGSLATPKSPKTAKMGPEKR
jgi:hypothetical protein